MSDDNPRLTIAKMGKDIEYIRIKIDDHCEEMKALRSGLTKTNDRVSALENWRSVTAAGLGLLALLFTWGWLKPNFI